MRVRRATDADSDAVIALVAAVFAEYPGCVLDVDREEPELRAPATRFDGFWILEDAGGAVAGCVGYVGHGDVAELKKLYLARSARRRGWGTRLVRVIEEAARAAGARRLELWSDTRFTAAHGLYARLGYHRTGRTRELHDLSETTEYQYAKDL